MIARGHERTGQIDFPISEDHVTTIRKHILQPAGVAEKPTLGMLAAGDHVKTLVGMNPGAAPNDIRACRLPAPGSTGSPAEHLP